MPSQPAWTSIHTSPPGAQVLTIKQRCSSACHAMPVPFPQQGAMSIHARTLELTCPATGPPCCLDFQTLKPYPFCHASRQATQQVKTLLKTIWDPATYPLLLRIGGDSTDAYVNGVNPSKSYCKNIAYSNISSFQQEMNAK